MSDMRSDLQNIVSLAQELERHYANEPLDLDPEELAGDFQGLAALIARLGEKVLEIYG